MTWNWLEKIQNINPMWKILQKEFGLGESTSFLDHQNMGCTQVQCEISKDIVKNFGTVFESSIVAKVTETLSTRKIWASLRRYMTSKVMSRNVWNDIVSEQTGRLNKKTKFQIHPLMTILSKKKNWNPWRIVQSMFSNCSEILLHDTYWKIWYSMISEQTCTIDRKMDESMSQTIVSFDILHPSHMWIQTILSCW